MNDIPPEATMQDSPLQQLPHNIEAEQSLLGAMLANNNAYQKVAEFLKPEHFAQAEHGRIYEAAAKLIDAGNLVDPITMKQYFEQESELTDIGGTKYLAQLAGSVVSIINAGEYGRIIHEDYRRREAHMIGQELSYGAIHDDLQVALEEHERALTALSDGGHKEISSAEQMKSTLAGIEAVYRGEQPPGIETGLADLDSLLGRVRNQDLLVIAGRPSMGKTILGINIAEKVAQVAPVQFFSLEMSAEQLNQRRIANRANVSITAMRLPRRLGREEMDKIMSVGQELEDKPFLIDDTPALSVSDIRRRARKQKRKGLGLVVVDYLGLMRAEDPRMNKVHQIEEITTGLKGLAKELDIPVILLSQLSRALEQRDNKRPALSDLRDSGSIEQDADDVLLLYREEYYLERDKPAQKDTENDEKFRSRCEVYKTRLENSLNKAEIIVAKQRQGPTGTVNVHFDGAHMRFANAIKEGMFQ